MTVSPYFITPQSLAILHDEGKRIRATLAAKRAQRELQRIVHGPLQAFEPLPVGEVTENEQGWTPEAS